MRKIETQEVLISITCDICKKVQPQQWNDIYWASRYSECYWHVPPDGVNHGTFKGDLCPTCRTAISDKIDEIVSHLKNNKGEQDGKKNKAK
jgi:hypothetical protein